LDFQGCNFSAQNMNAKDRYGYFSFESEPIVVV
jgi:hypothetical protein